ncbi:MAG: hypothetical protein O9275_02130, partial [Microcystis sp. LE19-196.1B]|nr:hypothetical protein [Microcystis sp. LE19-196.1B]
EEVKALQAKSDSLINELKNSAAKQEEVLKKVTALQAELAKVIAQIGTLNQQLGAQNADLDEIKSQLADLQKKYEGILKQLEQLQKLNQILAEIEKLKGQLAELDGKYQVIQGSLAQNKEQLDALKGQVASLQAQLAENLAKISQLTSQLGEQGADIEKILAAIEELKKNCAEIKALLENQLSGKSPIPTNGLVGWWPFNGNANDESGNGNNGTVSGAILSSDRTGKENNAYNTSSGSIDINKTIFNNGWNSYTVSVWLNYSSLSLTGGNVLINTVPHGGFAIGYSYFNSNRFSHFKNSNIPNSNSWDIFSDDKSNVSNLSANVWYNFIVTKSENNYKYYFNGVLDKSVSSSITPIDLNMAIKIGAIEGNLERFKGKLDDIAIWNRALTADEISKIYKGEGF